MTLATLSPKEIHAWVRQFHIAADSLTTTDLHKFYTKDCIFKMGNTDEIHRLDPLIAFFDGAFSALESMKHVIISIDTVPASSKIYLACTITYVIAKDPEHKAFTIPAFGMFDIVEGFDGKWGEEGCIRRFQVYSDRGELFGRMKELKEQGLLD